MKRILGVVAILFLLNNNSFAQQEKTRKNIALPSTVKAAFIEKYPNASTVQWKRKDDDYEAMWANGRLVTYTPSGKFIEETDPIPVNQLPEEATKYIHMTYNSKITGAGKVTDRYDSTSYIAKVNGRELIFDMNGRFMKAVKK